MKKNCRTKHKTKHKAKHTHKPKSMKFAELKVGDHFIYGADEEHIRLPIVPTGTPEAPGYVNAVRIQGTQLAGFGPDVMVVQIHHKKQNYNNFFHE